MTETPARFPLFDSLRALAALSVFAFHAAYILGALGVAALAPYALQLKSGVVVFFLISGFLLYRPFAQARFARSAPPAALPYGVRRVLRIVPAYWLALVGIALVLGLRGVLTLDGAPAYFGFAQVYRSETILGGIPQAWSLCVEVTFYALLPLWAWLMRKRGFRDTRDFVRTELSMLAGLYVLAVVWKLLVIRHGPAGSTLFAPGLVSLPSFLDHFALGMGLAVVSVASADADWRPTVVGLVERSPWIAWIGAGAAYSAFGLTDLVLGLRGTSAPSDAQFLVDHQLEGLVALALLLPAVFGDARTGAIRRLLAGRVLTWIGLVSYGVYLWHAAILKKLDEAGWAEPAGGAGLVVGALAASLVVAALSFYGLERHALRLGRRLSRSRSDPGEEPPSRPVPAPAATGASGPPGRP